MPIYTLENLCQILGESFEGDGTIELKGVAEITAAKEGEISFVANPKYVSKISLCNASALIVSHDLDTDFRPVIRSANPYLTFTKALHLFHKDNRKIAGGVHISSQVATSVSLGQDVTIMPHVIVENDVTIGDRAVIYSGVYLGKGTVIGNDVTLYPHVTIAPYCEIRDQVILHAGCRIGDNHLEQKPAQPCVVLERDVELGANVVVSGSPDAPTRIAEGTKIDNLVQIGAGTQIGPHCIIVAQVTLDNHVTLKERVTIAGQVVISSGVTVGERSRIGAKSVVVDDIPPDSDYWGAPAQPLTEEKRMKANLLRVPRLLDKLKTIEEQIQKDKSKESE
ncbi:MAG: UDP-3-O-(3-hydroxymyristoyl)glucosamine N-acyltransferase [bacterium]